MPVKHKAKAKAERHAAEKAAPAALAVTETAPTLDDVTPAADDPQLETGGARAPDAAVPTPGATVVPEAPAAPTPAAPEAVPATDTPPSGSDGGTAAPSSADPPPAG